MVHCAGIMASKNVFVPLADGFEEIETLTPVDLLRRAGAKVSLASVETGLFVTGRSDIVVRADVLFDAEQARHCDLLLIPGGPAVKQLRQHKELVALVREFAASGRWIGAICAASLVLLDAGLLAGRRFTAHSSTRDELPDALFAERVVRDGHLITSRGVGTALDFGLELVRALAGEDVAHRVAQDIMA
jgi:4-methyl-5(b-hydroxyethyl)-thiazole monophosphate biosynthesis